MVLIVQVSAQNDNIFKPGSWRALVVQKQFFRAVAHNRQGNATACPQSLVDTVATHLQLIVYSLTSRMVASSNEMKMHDG